MGSGNLPDTSIRPFFLLGGILVLLALDVTLTPARVSWLLTGIISALALGQFILVSRVMPTKEAPVAPSRLVKLWQREAWPQIVVTLYINFFADVDILLVTPLLTSAETAAIGLCLKLSLLVGFAVQIAHQVVVPDLADARARKDPHAIHDALVKAVAFPLIITFAALATVVLSALNCSRSSAPNSPPPSCRSSSSWRASSPAPSSGQAYPC
jgi:O-antigen/teichoic acid export membrane protein